MTGRLRGDLDATGIRVGVVRSLFNRPVTDLTTGGTGSIVSVWPVLTTVIVIPSNRTSSAVIWAAIGPVHTEITRAAMR